MIDFNTNPLFYRNEKNYYWSVSSTEGNIKRTHSGQPRNIADTLNNIIGIPDYGVGSEADAVLEVIDKRLKKILEDNDFDKTLIQRARPLTLVEGWGAWKINWDSEFRDTPILMYYRADATDFIYRGNQLIAIIYRDYYQNEKKENYVLFETRRIEKRECTIEGENKGKRVPCLLVEKELFKISGQSRVMTPMALSALPQLRDVEPCIIFENFDRFLGAPSKFFEDTNGDMPGRSIYAGKLDLFDDLDQCYSQAANTVRRSTVHEYFDTQYLEKDERTGMPIMPKAFDRSYIMYKGQRNGDGISSGSTPVQVVQPSVDFDQYSREEINILLNVISGLMSPATLGIDIAKKDNAEAQREKEKVTIFTRNTIIAEETRILKRIFNDLLCADEFMRCGYITNKDYDIFLRYSELASNSYENRLETVLSAWQAGIMSDELAIEMLHGSSLNDKKKEKELAYIKEQKEKEQQNPFGMGGEEGGMNPEDMGMFGELGAENDYNTEHEHPSVQDAIQDLGEM
jgi:hypothetical protein